MKNKLMIAASVLLLITFIVNAKAQEKSKWNAGLDIYSSYIWRGAKFGSGPAFQPSVEFSTGGFTIGAWGSVNTGNEEAAETDLYASYNLDLGEKASLNFTVTDYFYPGTLFFLGESHSIEPLVNLGIGGFTFTAAYMEGLGNKDINTISDFYLQAAFSAGPVDFFVGGGNGQYSYEDEGEADKFAISNIGVGILKEIKVTDSFSIPISGSLILNPSTEQMYVVVGISF